MLMMTARFMRRHPLSTSRGILTLNLSFKTPELAQEAFLNSQTQIDVPAFHKQLTRESIGPLRLMYPLTKVNAEKTPVLVVGAERDNIFTVDEQRSTARKYNARCVIIKNQAHNLMMESAWKETADIIDDWLVNELKLP